MTEAEAGEFVDDIIVTAQRLREFGGGSTGFNFEDYGWLNNFNNQSSGGFDYLAYLIGTDNIFYNDPTFDTTPAEPVRPSVDEFIDTVLAFIQNDFIGTITFSANLDEFGAPIDATFGIRNGNDTLDIFSFGRDSQFHATVPLDPNDFSPLPNQIDVRPEWADVYIV